MQMIYSDFRRDPRGTKTLVLTILAMSGNCGITLGPCFCEGMVELWPILPHGMIPLFSHMAKMVETTAYVAVVGVTKFAE